MASVGKDSKGWRIRFVDPDGNRRTLRLGKATKIQAESIGRHVENLVSAKTSGQSADRQTALWLSSIGGVLHDKLANAGLIESRESAVLGIFLDAYKSRRSDVKPATGTKWQTTINHLVEHFGEARDLRTITAGHADEFRSFLHAKGQSENTIRRSCGIAKQFFRFALRRKLIDENPFADQVASVAGNPEKLHFVTRQDAEKILNACPDQQWRMIFALCRFGGLRCPSEVLELRWSDINWETEKILIRSPKTEHHVGKESRIIPLFPELADELSDGQELATSEFVVTRYRDAGQNLRTTFLKIIDRAGLNRWPKPFQNLRTTRETELADEFPIQAVTAWIGNSEAVARKHYLQVTDEHFERATTKKVAHIVAHKTREETKTGKPTKAKNPEKLNVFRGSDGAFASIRSVCMGDEGLEPPTPSV